MDLQALTVPELVTLKENIESQLETKIQTEKDDLLTQYKEMAERSGLTIEDIIGVSSKKIRSTKTQQPPKYRNPDDKKQTWTGLGRKPTWVIEVLGQGKTLEQLEINKHAEVV